MDAPRCVICEDCGELNLPYSKVCVECDCPLESSMSDGVTNRRSQPDNDGLDYLKREASKMPKAASFVKLEVTIMTDEGTSLGEALEQALHLRDEASSYGATSIVMVIEGKEIPL